MIDNYIKAKNFEQLPSVKQKCDVGVTTKPKSKPHSIKANTPERCIGVSALDPLRKNQVTLNAQVTTVKKLLRNPAVGSTSSPSPPSSSSYKDQDFLKTEYELARSQVVAELKKSRKEGGGGTAAAARYNDDRNNNNNNNNTHIYSRHNQFTNSASKLAAKPPPSTQAASTCTPGRRFRFGAVASFVPSTTSVPLVNANGIQENKRITANNCAPLLPKLTTKVFAYNAASVTPVAQQPCDKTRDSLRPICGTDTTTTAKTAAATSVTSPKLTTDAFACTKVNLNNNMQHQQPQQQQQQHQQQPQQQLHKHQCSHLPDDDIKYIDSDELVTTFEIRMNCQQRCCHQQQLPATTRAKTRPKSTIICSTSQHNHPVFSKVNKYTSSTATSLSELSGVVSGTERRREATSSGGSGGGGGSASGIDSNSIKASIEKFNNLSKQIRIPLPFNTTTNHQRPLGRGSGGSSGSTGSGGGSTSNLQHNRYSNDFSDLSHNTRLQNALVSGGSLTRATTTRNYAGTSGAASKVVTNIYSATSASSTTTSPVAVKTKVHYGSNQSHSANATVAVAATGNAESSPIRASTTATASSMVKPRTLLRSTEPGKVVNGNNIANNVAAVASTAIPMSLATSNVTTNNAECSEHKLLNIENLGDSDTDDSVRSSSALRNALPPPSPTPLRYGYRELSRPTAASTSYNDSTQNDANYSANEKSEGLCGLRNIGNTCFMNSVIQCLSHTTELTKFLRTLNGVKAGTSKDQQILYEFAKLIREMWTASVYSVTPLDLKRAFSTKHRMFSDYNQQDAQEFLRFFLDSLHSALNSGVKGGDHLKIDENLSDNKKADLTWEWYTRHENSLIRDLFVGQLKSTLKCTACGNTSVTFDPFWDLSVSLPSSSRCKLDACLDLFIREEILDGDEMPTCSKCRIRRKCTKSFSIQRFPKYLVIHLKRFSETRWSKLSNIVEFPTGERELNMGPYGSNHNSNAYYSLYGISNHMGSTAGGHYVALCKHPVAKKWHEFNDNIVSDELSENHLVSSSAYILFYERA